jgi:hypothetical protein
MFKITPIQDKSRQKEICELCGADFRPDAFAYQMFDIDSGEIMGMSQFEIGEVGYIYDIKEAPNKNDFEAMFILSRQTMNFIDLCENHTCFADENTASERLLTAIGFKKQNDKYFCDMTGMFDGHCDGHKVEID